MITNLDFAPTLLAYAGVDIPPEMQGRSARALLEGNTPGDWRNSMYYRYWDHGGHNVCSHYGIRRNDAKLLYFHPQEINWRGIENP